MYRYAFLCAFVVFASSQVESENPDGAVSMDEAVAVPPPYDPTPEANESPSITENDETKKNNVVNNDLQTPEQQSQNVQVYSVPSEHSDINVEIQDINKSQNDMPTVTQNSHETEVLNHEVEPKDFSDPQNLSTDKTSETIEISNHDQVALDNTAEQEISKTHDINPAPEASEPLVNTPNYEIIQKEKPNPEEIVPNNETINQTSSPEIEINQSQADVVSVKESGSDMESSEFPVHPAAIAGITPPEFMPTPGIEAPSYTKLEPILGWNRNLSDSASTLKQWLRWWKYLNMKTPVIMPWLDGLKMRIYPGNEVYRAMFVKGIYDPNFSIAINSSLNKGGTFIDVGANIGNFSLLASKAVGTTGHVIAIEPSSRDYDRLVDNIRLNQLENVIAPYKFAVSDRTGEKATLQIANEERSALNTFAPEFSVKGITKVNTEEVETSTLDSFVERSGLSNIEAVKMDIEGSELKALHGAINTITKFRPVMMIGVNEVSLKASGTTRAEVQKFMQDHRYRMYKVSYKPRFAFVPVDDIAKTHAKVLFCFHESVIPPELPQPKEKTLMDYISDFFSK